MSRRAALQKSKGKFSFRRAPGSTSRPPAPPTTALAPTRPEQPEQPAPVPPSSAPQFSRPTPGRTWEHQRGATLKWSDELLLEKQGDLHLSHLDGCLVDLRTPSSLDLRYDDSKPNSVLQAVFVRNVHNSILLVGNVEGSMLVHDCCDTLIVGQCHQVRLVPPGTGIGTGTCVKIGKKADWLVHAQYRMHDSMRSVCLITTPSAITLEGCRAIRIGSCPLLGRVDDPNASQDNVPTLPGNVQDFDHVSRLTSSPNWTTCEDGTQVVGCALDLWSRGSSLASQDAWLALLQRSEH